jgi:ribose transport system ATP-binding protein
VGQVANELRRDPERPIIEARGIVKRFGGQVALDEIDFDLRAGEIHALLGENGAGKSTLIKILAGVVARDAGEIRLGDSTLPHHFTPADVASSGVAFVHQDLGLLDHLQVAENIALATGYERRGRLISFRRTEARVAKILSDLAIDVSPRAQVGELTQDQKVMVAVARAFSLRARAIVLDEVSSSLPAPDVARLIDALRAARRGGVGYVYVTHRLDEVFDLADRVTVLRNGRSVQTADVADTDHDEVVQWIIGSEGAPLLPRHSRRAASGGGVRLRVRELQGPGLSEPVSLDVDDGEIVAACGLVGCGSRAFAGLLGGSVRPTHGHVELDGAKLPLGSPVALRRAGCTYVPGDRQAAGTVPDLSVRENLFLPRLPARPGRKADAVFRWPGKERRESTELAEQFDIRPRGSTDRNIATLSGGNQQKVVAGRALRTQPGLLVVDDPTAGIDIAARAQMHAIIRQAADRGTIVILTSTDYDEVASESDRALVFWNGRVHVELAGDELTGDRLAQASYGPGRARSDSC